MATSVIGRQAETAVAKKLEELGYKVIAQNWKTPRCEIDIVAMKDKIAFLVEVKFRSSQSHGSGFEYIGPSKLKQINFAARVWEKETDWDGDICLLAAEVTGADFDKIKFTEVN